MSSSSSYTNDHVMYSAVQLRNESTSYTRDLLLRLKLQTCETETPKDRIETFYD